jgi:dephospho-CoA kinase
MILGLTGGIGMGKSTTTAFLSHRLVPVLDTDVIARQVVEPGEPALDEIQAVFGSDIVDGNGLLNRDRLARVVFSDKTKRKQLEAIVHPRIRERWLAGVKAWQRGGRTWGVVVIPLLFETAAEAYFDRILCVACSEVTQRQRLEKRGWSAAQIEQRISAQWPTEKKMALAHFVIWTEGSLVAHEEQLDQIIRTLRLA